MLIIYKKAIVIRDTMNHMEARVIEHSYAAWKGMWSSNGKFRGSKAKKTRFFSVITLCLKRTKKTHTGSNWGSGNGYVSWFGCHLCGCLLLDQCSRFDDDGGQVLFKFLNNGC